MTILPLLRLHLAIDFGDKEEHDILPSKIDISDPISNFPSLFATNPNTQPLTPANVIYLSPPSTSLFSADPSPIHLTFSGLA